ncbi:MAG: hypothetical protein RI958_2781 [Actinomycetota bacterium]
MNDVPTEASLPRLDVSDRAGRVVDRLGDLEALVVTDPTNIRWLTGFSGSNGVVVLLRDGVVLITDGRYIEQAERQMAAAGCAGRVQIGRTASDIVALAATAATGRGSVGFESAHVSHARWSDFVRAFDVDLVPTLGLVEEGRRVKDPAELARIDLACRIADQAFGIVAPTIVPGRTEIEIRNDLERVMRDLGAAGPSYETIVSTGPQNSPLPHHRPSPTVVEDGHTVIVDVGALVDGYHSDMTRTVVVGSPSPLQAEVYEVVAAAQLAGLAAVGPGVAVRDVDAACRSVISSAGFGPWFVHGTGHGVGLLIHEEPFLNSTSDGVLREGDVVTVEPGVYRGDFGGVRIEDLVEVTSTGCRTLTRTPKDAPCPPSPPMT